MNTVMFNKTYINKKENKMKNTDKKLKTDVIPNLSREKKRKELKCMNQQALEELVDKAVHVISGHMSFF